MDIICKCGHNVEQHLEYGSINYGCCYTNYEKSSNGGTICNCALSPSEVYEIHIIEQQARLDTCRGEIEALKEKNERLASFLRIYADPENWTSDNSFLFPSNKYDVPEHVTAYQYAETGLKLNGC